MITRSPSLADTEAETHIEGKALDDQRSKTNEV